MGVSFTYVSMGVSWWNNSSPFDMAFRWIYLSMEVLYVDYVRTWNTILQEKTMEKGLAEWWNDRVMSSHFLGNCFPNLQGLENQLFSQLFFPVSFPESSRWSLVCFKVYFGQKFQDCWHSVLCPFVLCKDYVIIWRTAGTGSNITREWWWRWSWGSPLRPAWTLFSHLLLAALCLRWVWPSIFIYLQENCIQILLSTTHPSE